MAVSTTLKLLTWQYGEPAEKGGAHGMFGVSGGVIGDGSAGDTNIIVDADIAWLRNKLLIFRHIVVGTNGTTARPVNLESIASYLQETPMGLRSGSTVVGRTSTSLNLVDAGGGLFIIPPNGVIDPTLFIVVGQNNDGETKRVYLAGEYWEQQRLRKDGSGPLIRW